MVQHVVRDADGKETLNRPVSDTFPLPIKIKIIDTLKMLRVETPDFDALLDVLERIEQQMAMINNNNNLAPGERFY